MNPHHPDEPAFSDDHRPEASVPFDYPGEPEAGDVPIEADTRAAQRETVARLLAVLLEGRPSPERIGRRVLAIGLLLRSSDAPESASEFARMLGVSPQRGWAIVEGLRAQLAGLEDRE